MVSGIGGYNNYISYLQTQTARGNGGLAEMFNRVDSDGSEGVSQSELDEWAEIISSETGNSVDTTDAVSTYDADGDGEMNEEELKSFMDANNMAPPWGMRGMGADDEPGRFFSLLDVDSSSGVSQSELDEWAEIIFAKTGDSVDTTDAISTYDTNGDGELGEDELKSFMEASGINPSPPPPGGARMMDWASSLEGFPAATADSIISEFDTDGDGLLSSDELQGYLDESATTYSETLEKQVSSAYRMNFGSGGFFGPEEQTFIRPEDFNGYSPVDLSA